MATLRRLACWILGHRPYYESDDGRVRLEKAAVDARHTREEVDRRGFGNVVCVRCGARLS